MINNFRIIDEEIVDMSKHIKCLDNMIMVGLPAFDTNKNSIIPNYLNSTTAQFVITTTLFPKYLNAHPYFFPIAPTINKGFANNVSPYVYDGFKELYELSKSKASVDYNTVSLNLGKKSVFKHKHGFATPDGTPVETEVFIYRLTNFSKPNNLFRLYGPNGLENYNLDKNCVFIFNSYIEHDTLQNDNNYYAYFIFEKWPN